ncbi:uncharacterized protein [Typha latifolia]|uniref:uncharacterized protein n=1 Tax=Typha latifolia TaxID=4733 RepID=UPI003C2BC827
MRYAPTVSDRVLLNLQNLPITRRCPRPLHSSTLLSPLSPMAAISATSHASALLFSPKTLTLKTPSSLLLRSHQILTPISLSLPSRCARSFSSPPPLKAILSSSSSAAAISADLESTRVNLKSRLAAGEVLYGLFLLSSSPTLAEIAGLAGYDYVVVDMEHGPGGISDALPCLRALAAVGTPAILRLPDSSPAWAKKALDLGPAGVMFPSVCSPREAELAVSYCRFPPRGVRGSAHTVVRASAYGMDDSYLARCEEETLIMIQVETAAAVAEIEAIAAVDGVDVVQMGPLDLSASMGYLWDPGNRKVREAVKEAERRVLGMVGRKEKRVYLGGFAMPHDAPEQLKLRGYHMVAGAVDVGMFRKAAVEDVRRFKSAEVEIGEEDGEEEKPDDDKYWSE